MYAQWATMSLCWFYSVVTPTIQTVMFTQIPTKFTVKCHYPNAILNFMHINYVKFNLHCQLHARLNASGRDQFHIAMMEKNDKE